MPVRKIVYHMERYDPRRHLNNASKGEPGSPLDKTRPRKLKQMPRPVADRPSEPRRRRSRHDKSAQLSIARQHRATKGQKSGGEASSKSGSTLERLKLVKATKTIHSPAVPLQNHSTSIETTESSSVVATAKVWEPPPKPKDFDESRPSDEPTWEELYKPIPEHHKFVHVLNHFRAWNE